MQIICCGCSWANGAELGPNEEPFGGLLAKKLRSTYIHAAQDAASIPHMILQLRSAVEKIQSDQETVAVFLLPSPDRDLMWSKTRAIGNGHIRDNPPPYESFQTIFLNGNDPLHRDWFMEYHSEPLGNFRANTSILTLQKLCQYHRIRDYYAWAWHTVPIWSEVDATRFYRQGLTDIRDHIDYHPPRHPDQAQHIKICDLFHDMIVRDHNL